MFPLYVKRSGAYGLFLFFLWLGNVNVAHYGSKLQVQLPGNLVNFLTAQPEPLEIDITRFIEQQQQNIRSAAWKTTTTKTMFTYSDVWSLVVFEHFDKLDT